MSFTNWREREWESIRWSLEHQPKGMASDNIAILLFAQTVYTSPKGRCNLRLSCSQDMINLLLWQIFYDLRQFDMGVNQNGFDNMGNRTTWQSK